jgi:hypothetical protein
MKAYMGGFLRASQATLLATVSLYSRQREMFPVQFAAKNKI